MINHDRHSHNHLRDTIIRAENPYGLQAFIPGSLAWILDLGAHVGAFAMCARFRHPLAAVYAVEPDPDSFESLSRNADLLDIQCIPAALGRPGKVAILKPVTNTRRHGSMQHACAVQDGGPVVSLPLTSLVDRCGLDLNTPGFVKMDIEGGEYSVFNDPDSVAVLTACAGVSIEVHPPIDGGSPFPLCDRISKCFVETHDVTVPYRKHRGCLLYAVSRSPAEPSA